MIRLEIVTPERSLLDINCSAVTLPGAEGELEVLPGHTPMLSALKTGLLSFALPAGQKKPSGFDFVSSDILRLMVADGFVEIGNDRVRVLSEAAALPGEVDAKSESELIERLTKKLKALDEGDDRSFRRLQAEIERAAVKLLLT